MLYFLIGISVYKQPIRWVKQAIDSVVNQSFSDWGLVVRLDGPEALSKKEQTKLQDYLSQYCDKNIIVLRGSKRIGTFGSYKSIFSKYSSQYIMQLDADDFLEANALELFFNALSNNQNASYAYACAKLIDHMNDKIGYDKRAKSKWSSLNELTQFITFHPRVIKREAYDAVGGYSSNFDFTGDYDLSLKLSEFSQPIRIDQYLYNYRVHPQSESQTNRIKTHNEAVTAARNALKRRCWTDKFSISHDSRREVVDLLPSYESPIIVSGMHKSGTSLISLLLSKYGINMGHDGLAPDQDNPNGYIEDAEFLSLQRKWFDDYFFDQSKYDFVWRDGGFSELCRIPPLGLFEWRSDAVSLFNLKQQEARSQEFYWGWKDPRVSLILPFWKSVCSKIRVVCCFRPPWDVLDSLLRRKLDDTFQKSPFLAIKTWLTFYSAIHDYQQNSPESVIVVNTSYLKEYPGSLLNILRQKWGILSDQDFLSDLSQQNYEDVVLKVRLKKAFEREDFISRLYQLAFPSVMYHYNYFNSILDLPVEGFNSSSDSASSLSVLNDATTINGRSHSCLFVIAVKNPSPLLLSSIASILEIAESNKGIGILVIDQNTTLPESINLLYSVQKFGVKVLSGLDICSTSGALKFLTEFLSQERCRPEHVCLLDENIRLPADLSSKAFSSFAANQISIYGLKLGSAYDLCLNGVSQCALVRCASSADSSLILLFAYDFFLQWCIDYKIFESPLVDDLLQQFYEFSKENLSLLYFE